MASHVSRREALLAATGLPLACTGASAARTADSPLMQSVCRWCYAKMPLDRLCQEARRIGYRSVELLNPDEFIAVKRHGLTCAVLNGGRSVTIANCLNRPENHGAVERDLRAAIDFAAAEGIPNVICFSGNRRGMPDDVGLKNCESGLKRVVGHAESRGVTVVMELLNSKVDHKDYMADRTEWGVELVRVVGSPRFKLLYDIYHMQVMEGNVIATIRRHHEAIAHYHTAGVPGRNEIDDGQELNYPAVIRAIRATGYQGYVGQEFIPRRDPVMSLAEGFRVCNV